MLLYSRTLFLLHSIYTSASPKLPILPSLTPPLGNNKSVLCVETLPASDYSEADFISAFFFFPPTCLHLEFLQTSSTHALCSGHKKTRRQNSNHLCLLPCLVKVGEGKTQVGFAVKIMDFAHIPAQSVSQNRWPGIIQKGT